MHKLYYYYQFFLCNLTFISLRTLPTAVAFPEILYGFSIILKTGNDTAYTDGFNFDELGFNTG